MSFLSFLLPLGVWFALHHPYFNGSAVLTPETYVIMAHTISFLDQLRSGVIPFLNPYIVLGYANQLSLTYFGYCNPVWLAVYLFEHLGHSPYFSFVLTISVYFLSGVFAFYLLARQLFRHHLAAYCAFLLLLFSSVNFSLFAQFHTILIFVPGMWCLFFLRRFYNRPDNFSFIGLTLLANLILGAYLPFYFLTVLLFLTAAALALYPRRALLLARRFIQYIRGNRLASLFCLFTLATNLAPGIEAFRLVREKEVVAIMRGQGSAVFENGVAFSDYNATTDGDLGARMYLTDIYSRQTDIDYGNDGMIYIPPFGLLILLVSAFFRVRRRSVFFCGVAALLFLLLLGDGALLHPFLYQHVSYFRWLRNLFFLLPYLVAFLILLICQQIDDGLDIELTSSRKKTAAGIIALTHAGAFVFLAFPEAVIPSTFLTILASGVFLTCFALFRARIPAALLPLLICGVVLIQPVPVLKAYNVQAPATGSDGQKGINLPRTQDAGFRFHRIKQKGEDATLFKSPIQHCQRILAREDTLFYPEGFAAYWTYYLFTNIRRPAFDNYTQHKFVLYDHIQYREGDVDFGRLEASLGSLENTAYVIGGPLETLRPLAEADRGLLTTTAQVVDRDTPGFSVLRHTVNDLWLKTDFPVPRFLVYNDSYFKGWRASLNGRGVPVFRANVAFKGIYLPGGENLVHLFYRPRWGRLSYTLPFINNLILFAVLLFPAPLRGRVR